MWLLAQTSKQTRHTAVVVMAVAAVVVAEMVLQEKPQ